jgi:2-polyprenyl-6-methoxyphenol hydroxylase-like FAD-dependent oxidoreductase
VTDYDAVVSGAGPAGLVLAAALGGQGRRVLLVEKRPSPAQLYKGEALQPGSQQILAGLGLLKPAQQAGHLRAGNLQCADAAGRRLVALDYTRLDTPYNCLSVHYYHELCAALAANLPTAVELVQGMRSTGLLNDRRGRVVGIRTSRGEVSAALTVGCEGQR